MNDHKQQHEKERREIDQGATEEGRSLSKETQKVDSDPDPDPDPREERERGEEGMEPLTGNKRQREQVFETLILFSGFPAETNQIKDLSQKTIELNGRIFEGHSVDQTISHIVISSLSPSFSL